MTKRFREKGGGRMQLGGIRDDHDTGMHHVTSCLHDHGHSLEGNLKAASAAGAESKRIIREDQGQNVQLSLADWVRKLFRETGGRFLGFWRGNPASSGETGENAGIVRTPMPLEINDASVISKSPAGQSAFVQQNAYFAAVSPQPQSMERLPLGQRIKMKCRKAAGQMADHLPGRFLARFGFQKKGSFQSGKESAKEDLRRRSRYREDTLEIECVLTDESYLLDSYDRNGEYTQLTTRK